MKWEKRDYQLRKKFDSDQTEIENSAMIKKEDHSQFSSVALNAL